MLILLPPSEGKRAPVRGRPVDLGALSFPELSQTRRVVLDGLVRLCRDDPGRAREVLGLSAGQGGEVVRNQGLLTAPAAAAGSVYAGVLYEALSLSTLSVAAKRRAASRLGIASALFGLLRVTDRIPAYRLGGGVSLPDLGPLSGVWREPVRVLLEVEMRRGLVVDLRSSTYAAVWRGPADSRRFVSVRVLQEVDGVRSVVSHFNKATKGALTRDLLEDGANPTSVGSLAAALRRLGWQVEQPAASRLDVIVDPRSERYVSRRSPIRRFPG